MLPNHFLSTATISATRDVIHRRFIHLYKEGLLKLDAIGLRGAYGFANKLSIMQFCPSCDIGKSRVADINRARDSDPSHLFHTVALDIWN